MKKLIWRIQALYWFWRLAGYVNWQSTQDLWEGYGRYLDEPREAVEDELEEWSR